MSHIGVAAFALIMGIAGVVFFYIGISMGWLYTFMGVILGSAVVPIALCITWRKASKIGCIAGAVVGLIAGIAAWLGTTAGLNNSLINVTTSGGNYEMLAGNLGSIAIGGIIAVSISLIWPEDYDFASTRAINSPEAPTNHKKPAEVVEEYIDEKKDSSASSVENDAVKLEKELDPVGLNKAFRFAAWSSIVLTLIFMILIPLPLFGASTIYSVSGFSVWVIVGIMWTFCSAFAVVLYPLWESRAALTMIVKGIIKVLFLAIYFMKRIWLIPRE
ncbi:hypothetical protein ID866_6974 [Astraeus odoratus]|nr:hypothetical protein ID866_6974 [Astraeus odoratus]